MKRFLFITHKTPSAKQSLLRKNLYGQYLKSLRSQNYSNWKALIIGEEEYEDNNFKIVKIDYNSTMSVSDQIFELYERKDVTAYFDASDFIIKLDDDDIISPTILEAVNQLEFDVCFDLHHTVYDVTSGAQTQQVRNWIASTCIHKTTHALSKIEPSGPNNYFANSLLYTEHSKTWIAYYSDKKKIITKKEHPVYLRVLSPTSITAGAKKLPINEITDIDFKNYYRYLKTFGYWRENHTSDFDVFKQGLSDTWKIFSGKEQTAIRGISILDEFRDRIINYGARIRKLF